MVAYTIKEDSAKMWCVWRGPTYLADRMTLGRAITEAGKMARSHHTRTGVPVTVELETGGTKSLLTRYAQPSHADRASVAA